MVFFAHDKNLILEISQLIAKKEDILEVQNILGDLNIVELSTRERLSSKWEFLSATNVTVSAALLKSVLLGCKVVFLPQRLVKRIDVNCLTYKANKECYHDHLCLLRAFGMHKIGTERLEEETSHFLTQDLSINSNVTAEKFRGFSLEDLNIVEPLAEVIFFIYDSEVLVNEFLGAFVERRLRRLSSMGNRIRYNNHICYVTDAINVFRWFRCFNSDNFFRRSSKKQQL